MKINIPNTIKAELSGLVSRGIKAAEVNGSGHLIFTLTDNSTADMGEVKGEQGVGVSTAAINGEGHLIITLTSGTVIDCGLVSGAFNIHGLTTEDAIADGDELVIYDVSASAHRKTAWSNAKAKLKTYFDTLYLTASDISDMATKTWVEAKGYLTSHQSLAGYATEAWVTAKNYLTEHQSLAAYRTSAAQDIIDGEQNTAIGAKYTKPASGIPDSDLASTFLKEHQSLAAYSTTAQMNTAIAAHHDSTKQDTIADLATIRSGAAAGATAVQTETDPVFAASAAHGISAGDISNWNGKGTYSKPSGGIPKTDLAAAVQTSLDKADSALQSHQDISGKQNATDNNLTTTAKTVVGAINEHESDISQLSSDKVDKASQVSKTAAMTSEVGIDANGKLWTAPGGGGSSDNLVLIESYTTSETIAEFKRTAEPDGTPYSFKKLLVYIKGGKQTAGGEYGTGTITTHVGTPIDSWGETWVITPNQYLNYAQFSGLIYQEIKNGCWLLPQIRMSRAGQSGSNTSEIYNINTSGGNISWFSVSATQIPAGVTFTIYGERV